MFGHICSWGYIRSRGKAIVDIIQRRENTWVVLADGRGKNKGAMGGNVNVGMVEYEALQIFSPKAIIKLDKVVINSYFRSL